MAQRKWKDSDISAYIDGELGPKAHEAFEARLAEDPALRRRLEQMEEVVNLVRAAPLREPPRNYLLTPSMVAEPEARREEARAERGFRLPMWAMRLATSVTAAAFVVVLSLNLFQQGLSPRGMMTEQAPPPEALMLESEASPTVEAVEAPAFEAEEAGDAEMPADGPQTESPEAESLEVPEVAAEAEGTLTPEERQALEPMPNAEGAPDGMGGGGEPEMAAAPQATDVAESEEAVSAAKEAGEETEEAVADAAPSPTPEAEPIEGEAPMAQQLPETYSDDETEAAPDLGAAESPEPPRDSRLGGLAALLGALTAVLGALTFWMSRNRR